MSHAVDTGIFSCLVRIGAGMHHKSFVFSLLFVILPIIDFIFLVTPGHKPASSTRLEQNSARYDTLSNPIQHT